MDQVVITGITSQDLFTRIEEIVSKQLQSVTPAQKEREYLSVAQAAEFLGLSKQSIYKGTSGNTIPHLKKGGKIWFERARLVKWLQSGKQ
jgi:excisionase family DNA binding protein